MILKTTELGLDWTGPGLAKLVFPIHKSEPSQLKIQTWSSLFELCCRLVLNYLN